MVAKAVRCEREGNEGRSMNTLTKRIEALESASGDMPPEVETALRELLGITGPVVPGWLSTVSAKDLAQARERLLAERDPK